MALNMFGQQFSSLVQKEEKRTGCVGEEPFTCTKIIRAESNGYFLFFVYLLIIKIERPGAPAWTVIGAGRTPQLASFFPTQEALISPRLLEGAQPPNSHSGHLPSVTIPGVKEPWMGVGEGRDILRLSSS